MLLYRIEIKDRKDRYYGYFTWGNGRYSNNKLKELLNKFDVLYARNVKSGFLPNPCQEGICKYVPSNYTVACKSLEELFYVWFNGKYWLIKEALKLFQLSVYQVPNRYVAKGNIQAIFHRDKATLVETISYEELESYIKSMEYSYEIPKSIVKELHY